MNEIFERMKALLKKTGIVFNEGGISNAEIYAYAYAIKAVRDDISAAVDELFLENGANAHKYAKLLNIDESRYTQSELEEEIKSRFAMNFATATVEDFDAAFDAVGSGSYSLSLSEDDNVPEIIFSGVRGEDMPQLAKFIEAYTYTRERTFFDGDGMTFDDWDDWDQSFYMLDKMSLPFNIIDSLRSDIIE